jgi:hypothetical protein
MQGARPATNQISCSPSALQSLFAPLHHLHKTFTLLCDHDDLVHAILGIRAPAKRVCLAWIPRIAWTSKTADDRRETLRNDEEMLFRNRHSGACAGQLSTNPVKDDWISALRLAIEAGQASGDPVIFDAERIKHLGRERNRLRMSTSKF